jgi:hypothetical protein
VSNSKSSVPHVAVTPKKASSRNTGENWINAAFAAILGALTPVIVAIGFFLTLFLGPLAFIAAPVVVIVVSRLLAQFFAARAGLRWFWKYGGCTAVTFALFIVPALWPRHPEPSGLEPGSLGGGFGAALFDLGVFAAAVLWLIGFLSAVPGVRRKSKP